MIARRWTAELVAGAESEYEDFAATKSAPMFARHDGFIGLVFLRDGQDAEVITFWTDEAAADALERSDTYKSVVDEILASGTIQAAFPTTRQTVHALDVSLRPARAE